MSLKEKGIKMWYLNSTNTEEIIIGQVKEGDIITMTNDPAHGYKVQGVCNSRMPGRKTITGGMGTWQAPITRHVLRVLKNADGTVMAATDR